LKAPSGFSAQQALFLAVSLCCASPAAAQTAGKPPLERSVREGVYTQAQAERGQTTFRQICGSCHTLADFSGEGFLRRWNGIALATFFDVMSTTMPQDNPGGLTAQQYADVIAYFLSQNRLPAGATELPTEVEVLSKIAIQPPAPSSPPLPE
jgi:mono/diheme cytochrome c family protein